MLTGVNFVYNLEKQIRNNANFKIQKKSERKLISAIIKNMGKWVFSVLKCDYPI